MAATDPEPIIDLDRIAALKPADRLRWRDRVVEVVEVVRLTADYDQVVLRFLDDPDALPVSVPARDLIDAEPL